MLPPVGCVSPRPILGGSQIDGSVGESSEEAGGDGRGSHGAEKKANGKSKINRRSGVQKEIAKINTFAVALCRSEGRVLKSRRILIRGIYPRRMTYAPSLS